MAIPGAVFQVDPVEDVPGVFQVAAGDDSRRQGGCPGTAIPIDGRRTTDDQGAGQVGGVEAEDGPRSGRW